VLHIVSMKVYRENENGDIDKKWYKIKNGEEVLKMELCTGDQLIINGIGKLEIIGLYYNSQETGSHPFRSLEITCHKITN
jgi:hypothetical protein